MFDEATLRAVNDIAARRAACGLTEAAADREVCGDAQHQALADLLSYRPVSTADARAKVEARGALNQRGMFEGLPWALDCLMESLLPEGEDLPEGLTMACRAFVDAKAMQQ